MTACALVVVVVVVVVAVSAICRAASMAVPEAPGGFALQKRAVFARTGGATNVGSVLSCRAARGGSGCGRSRRLTSRKMMLPRSAVSHACRSHVLLTRRRRERRPRTLRWRRMGRRLLARIARPINEFIVSFQPVKKWCEQKLGGFLVHDYNDCRGLRCIRTQIGRAVAVPVLGPGLFAVDLAQKLPPAKVATRHGVLDSSRRYNSSSALRGLPKVEKGVIAVVMAPQVSPKLIKSS
jgi:hypothetical protein